ncbi:hypothetical protein ADUPG1_001215 [Aduncisulcus paluster]|nr:hypothetical protein ADUPG1_001215 [Aduncisulcus paluster]
MSAIKRAGIPIVSACEGNMACGTCHIVLDKGHFDALAPASEDEQDTLDFVPKPTDTSRLACALHVSPMLDGATISIPGMGRNLVSEEDMM